MPAPYFIVPFATGGDQLPDGVPVTLQPDGSISYTLGWGPDYELDDTQPSYKPVGRREMNSMFNGVTWAIGEMQQLGYPLWRTEAAPYPIDAVVRHNDFNYLSTVTNNSTTPGAAGANWQQLLLRRATALELAAGANVSATVNPADVATMIGALSPSTPDATTTVKGKARFGTLTEQLSATSGVIADPAGVAAQIAASRFGYGPKNNVTASRVSGTTYTNSGTKPRFVSIYNTGAGNSYQGGQMFVNGDVVARVNRASSTIGTFVDTLYALVPPGATYSTNLPNIQTWTETE